MTRKGPTSVEWLTPDVAKELGGHLGAASAAESNSYSAKTQAAAAPTTARTASPGH
jgi:hypothetical protein